MKIGSFDTDEKVLVVAEIGNNHEGDFALAEHMIDIAAQAGVDAVKFQTFRTELFISSNDSARFDRLKSFELTFDQFEILSRRAKSAGLLFLSTPLDLESARFLDGIVDAFKIASCDNTFYPLLDLVGGFGKPVLLSAGLLDLPQVERSVRCIERAWQDGPNQCSVSQDLAVLHCVTSYPVDPEQANLGAIEHLRSSLDCEVGYSDHTLGIEACVLAAAMGARVIEKHFTINKEYSDFRDHQLSADPAEMTELVQRIRNAEVLRGNGEKTQQICEREIEQSVRRSIAAKRDLSIDEVIQWDDLMWIRPGGGLVPGDEESVVGRTLKRAIASGELIDPAALE